MEAMQPQGGPLISTESRSVPVSTLNYVVDGDIMCSLSLLSVDVRCEMGRYHTTSHLETLLRL